MNQPDGSDPFGIGKFRSLLTQFEAAEKKLEVLESKHVSVIKELNEAKLELKQFNLKSSPTNLRNLHRSIKEISKNQIYDLSIMLGFYAQRQSWIKPKEIAESGKRHSYSVVIKNLTGQDREYPWARGSPEIRKLCSSKIINKRRVFITKGLVAEFSISFFHLRKRLNLVSDVMKLVEDFVESRDGMKELAVNALQISDDSDERLKKYHDTKLRQKSIQQIFKKVSDMKETAYKALEMIKKNKSDYSTIKLLNESINNLLSEIRDSNLGEIITKLKKSTPKEAKKFFDYHKHNLEGCKMLLQYCKSFIDSHTKNHELSRIKIEINKIFAKFVDLGKIAEKLELEYTNSKITKKYYEKQERQIEKTMEVLAKRFLVIAKPFKITWI